MSWSVLAELFLQRGPPAHIRSDNGPEFCAEAVKRWLKRLNVNTLFIEPGSPWENGYIESFNGKLRDELLNLEEAQVLVADWRDHYNRYRPHSSLGYRPPAPEAWTIQPLPSKPAHDLRSSWSCYRGQVETTTTVYGLTAPLATALQLLKRGPSNPYPSLQARS